MEGVYGMARRVFLLRRRVPAQVPLYQALDSWAEGEGLEEASVSLRNIGKPHEAIQYQCELASEARRSREGCDGIGSGQAVSRPALMNLGAGRSENWMDAAVEIKRF